MELQFYKRDIISYLFNSGIMKPTSKTDKNSTPFVINYQELNTGAGLNAIGRALSESLHDLYDKKGINVITCDDATIMPIVVSATLLFQESFHKEIRFIDARKKTEKELQKNLKKGDKIVVISDRAASYKLFSRLRKLTESIKDASVLGHYTIIGSQGGKLALITLKDIEKYYREKEERFGT